MSFFNPIPSKEISVLLPTRGRPELMFKSLKTLIDNAKNTSDIEFLIAIDNDDQSSHDYINDNVLPWFDKHKYDIKVFSMERAGYEQLQKYVNFLGFQSCGRWMLFWNDDAIMQSKNWDEDITQHNGKLSIIRFKDNHNSHPYSVFPVVPREWIMLFETLSPAQQTDSWISQVAYLTDCMITIDSEVLHDRADLTGNNDDEIYQERVYLTDDQTPEMFKLKQHYAAKWNWLQTMVNQSSGWWDKIQAGEVDPWEKMLAVDVNKQMVTIPIETTNES